MVFFADPYHLSKTIDSLRNCFLIQFSLTTDCQMIQWNITLQQIQNLAIRSLNSQAYIL